MTKVVLYQLGRNSATEEKIKDLTNTIIDVSLDGVEEAGSCILTGNPSGRGVLFAKAY
jgi:prolyl-tRNA synthetase